MIDRYRRKGGALTEVVLILAGLGLLVKAAMVGTGTYKFIHLAQPIDGVVSGLGDHGLNLYVHITPGQDQSTVFLQKGFLFGYQMNQTVSTLYDPANPEHASLDKWSALWFDTLVFGIPGFLLAFIGFRMRSARNV